MNCINQRSEFSRESQPEKAGRLKGSVVIPDGIIIGMAAERFFEDAQHADIYARFRPHPPKELTERIVTYLKEKVILHLPFRYQMLSSTCLPPPLPPSPLPLPPIVKIEVIYGHAISY